MSFFIRKIFFPILTFICIFALIICFFKNKQKNTNSVYTLKSYKNTVALYKNDQLVKSYESIVLNTLPQKDIQNFNTGISFDNQLQAELYLEDFE